jgi:hypothetical protein
VGQRECATVDPDVVEVNVHSGCIHWGFVMIWIVCSLVY